MVARLHALGGLCAGYTATLCPCQQSRARRSTRHLRREVPAPVVASVGTPARTDDWDVRVYALNQVAHQLLTGIKVWAVLLFVYCFSGLAAGLGGVMSAARLYAANGLQLGQSYELDAIAAVILGGTSFVGGIGSIWGTLIGALIIAILTNGLILIGVSDIWQFIIKGLVIIGAVALDRYRLKGSART